MMDSIQLSNMLSESYSEESNFSFIVKRGIRRYLDMQKCKIKSSELLEAGVDF
jgi:hypothetical protein